MITVKMTGIKTSFSEKKTGTTKLFLGDYDNLKCNDYGDVKTNTKKIKHIAPFIKHFNGVKYTKGNRNVFLCKYNLKSLSYIKAK